MKATEGDIQVEQGLNENCGSLCTVTTHCLRTADHLDPDRLLYNFFKTCNHFSHPGFVSHVPYMIRVGLTLLHQQSAAQFFPA